MKQISPAIIAAIAVCAGYLGSTQVFRLDGARAGSLPPSSPMEETKTDFISIGVFDGDRVKGYVSFRLALPASDASRAAEVGYMASDILIRSGLRLEDIGPNLPALAARLEQQVKKHAEGKLPPELVKSVRIADFGFDARI